MRIQMQLDRCKARCMGPTAVPVHLPSPEHELAGINATLVLQHKLLVDGRRGVQWYAVFRDQHKPLVQGVLQCSPEQPLAGFC